MVGITTPTKLILNKFVYGEVILLVLGASRCITMEPGAQCVTIIGATEGRVVCRMLGYNYVVQFSCCAKYGRGTGPIWLDNFRCNGSESNLASCTNNGWGIHDCSHNEDASVVCSNSPVRLLGGSSSLEGRVEIYREGAWRRVCDSNWTLTDAHVVCKTLGYSSALYASADNRYGQGDRHVWLNNVQCNGSEKNLIECPHQSWDHGDCSKGKQVGVICSRPTEKMTDRPIQQQLVKSSTTVVYVAAVSFLSLLVCILFVVGAYFVYRQTLRHKPCTEQTSSKNSGSTKDGNKERINQSDAGLTDYEEVICRSTNSSSGINKNIINIGNNDSNNTSVNNDNGNDANYTHYNAVSLPNDDVTDFSVDESSSGTIVGNRYIAPFYQPRVMLENLKRPTPSTKPTRTKPHGESGNYMELSPTRREGIETSSDSQKTNTSLYQSLVKRGDLNRDNAKEPLYNNVNTKAV